MHMPSGIVPDYLLMIYGVITTLGLLLALWRINMRQLVGLERGVIIGLSYASLCGLYLLSAGIKPGMQVHFLGVMLTVMMFGPWLAMLLLTAVHLTLTFAFHVGSPETLGFNLLWTVLWPVLVAASIHVFSYLKLPRTFPVYIIQVGIGDLICTSAVDLALSIHLHWLTNYTADIITTDFSLVLFLMGTMEAMISTMIASLLVCYVPQALVTFSDEEYLHGK